jgi:hypothetical protein
MNISRRHPQTPRPFTPAFEQTSKPFEPNTPITPTPQPLPLIAQQKQKSKAT